MKTLSALSLTSGLAFILACSGPDCGRKASKVVPVLKASHPEYEIEAVDCDPPYSTPSMRGCSMGTITCGESVQGNTGAGKYKFGDTQYQTWFCTPQRNDYDDSPEAVYTLEVPADVQADVILASDCADLDLVAVAWNETDRCPTSKHSIRECEMDTSSGGGKVRLTTVNKPQTYLLVVDGKQGAEGNFRVEVKCSTYR